MFIDGVYRSRTGAGLTELGPLDRIEVLRGPQGTLFGRNTSAGLISIITAKPRFTPEVSGQIDIGNYNLRRFQGASPGRSATRSRRASTAFHEARRLPQGRDFGPPNQRPRPLAAPRPDAVPADDNLSFRLIGDYSKRNEECCGATYLPAQDYTAAGPTTPRPLPRIERGLGGIINDDTFSRDVSITPGRDYDSRGKGLRPVGRAGVRLRRRRTDLDHRLSLQQVHLAARTPTSTISTSSIATSDGNSFNRFKTFTQELRLQGNAWNNRLDWLIGGYYANEKLAVDDNLTYGNDYSRYGNCLVAANFASSAGVPPTILAPGASPTCFNPAVATGVRAAWSANTWPRSRPAEPARPPQPISAAISRRWVHSPV